MTRSIARFVCDGVGHSPLPPTSLPICNIKHSTVNPLLVGCHPFSPANHLVIENHRSLIQICITPSLESTPWFIPSASPVLSRLTSSFTCQLISIIITSLIIHHSFTLSLQAQNLPFQQILPTLDFFYLLPTGLPSWQRDWTGPIMLIVLFLVSHYNFLLSVDYAGYPSAFYCTLNTQYRIVTCSKLMLR